MLLIGKTVCFIHTWSVLSLSNPSKEGASLAPSIRIDMPAEYISCLPNPYCHGSFFQYQRRKARQDSTDCHGLFPTPAPLSLPAES